MEEAPQSIVHQVLRMERKVVRAVKKRASFEDLCTMAKKATEVRHGRNARFRIRRGSRATSRSSSSSVNSQESLGKASAHTTSGCSSCESFTSTDREATNDQSVAQEEKTSPEDLEIAIQNLTVSVPKPNYGNYKTINQNEFFVECMIDAHCTSIVHFFDDENETSRCIDGCLEKLTETYPKIKFLRIDGGLTHFVAAKLGILKFPTVVALRKKVILDRLADFEDISSGDESAGFLAEFLSQWLVETIPMP